MRFTLKVTPVKFTPAAFCCVALLAVLGSSSGVRAESAFVQQAPIGGRSSAQAVPLNFSAAQTPNTSWMPHPGMTPRPGATPSTPEIAVPAGGANFASTLEIGQYNHVLQAQAGSGNISNVGIVKGVNNNVGVLQAGHSLVSNLLLVNTAGLNIGVIQPPGSAPVNMLIARLPNGALLIKR
jgi:hypothetical protein